LEQEIKEPLAQGLITTYVRDLFGNVTALIRESNLQRRVLITEYDEAGRVPVVLWNELGQARRLQYSSRYGGIVKIADESGRVQVIERDSFDNILAVSSEDRARYEVKRVGCHLAHCPIRSAVMEETTSSDGVKTIRFIGVANEIVETWTITPRERLVVTYRYDDRGALLGTRAWSDTDKGLERAVERDAFGRVTRRLLGGKVQFTASYQGFDRLVTDAVGGVARTRFRRDGKPILLVSPSGTRTEIKYDVLGRPRLVIREGLPVLENRYDPLGRRIFTRTAEAGATYYEYNDFDELMAQEDASGQITYFDYDALGRMIRRKDAESDTHWIYDRDPRAIGKLSEIKHGQSYDERLAYDEHGRLKSRSYKIDGSEYKLGYVYDGEGRVSQLIYPNGFKLNYLYAFGNVLREIRNGDNEFLYWRAELINSSGQIERASLGNGVIVDNTFDPETGQLTKQFARHEWNREVIQSISYDFDPAGRLSGKTDHLNEAAHQYRYDAAGHLVRSEVIGEEPLDVDYDSLGRTSRRSTIGKYAYGERGNPLTATTSIGDHHPRPIFYDDFGRQTRTFNGDRIHYTDYGKPRIIESEEMHQRFVYGPGRELIKTIATPKPRIRPLQPTQIEVGETVQIGGIFESHTVGRIGGRQVIYVIGPTGVVAALICDRMGEKACSSMRAYYLHADQLGSPNAVSDANGRLIAKFGFTAWGEERGDVPPFC
jgi:YD repeat-containing protein